MPRRLVALATLPVALVLAGPASALAARSPGGAVSHPTRYYLALGDSLSRGQQPTVAGVTVNTAQGYPNQLLAIERQRVPGLRLVQLGCGGESTSSFLTGKGNALAAGFHCHPAGGSQLKAAQRFLRAHHRPGEVALITIDLGANDIDGCAKDTGAALIACVQAGEASIKKNMPVILSDLRRAAARGTALAASTLYDPVLAGYLSADANAKLLAQESVPIIRQVNDEITSADRGAAFKTADVANAFKTYDQTDMTTYQGQMVPVDVAEVCTLTWACTPKPQGPNIHANVAGYGVIAAAFETVLGRLR